MQNKRFIENIFFQSLRLLIISFIVIKFSIYNIYLPKILDYKKKIKKEIVVVNLLLKSISYFKDKKAFIGVIIYFIFFKLL